MASSRVRTQRLEAVPVRECVSLVARMGLRKKEIKLTGQLCNAVFIGVGASRPETGSLVGVRAQKNGDFGEFSFAVAYLRILGDEDVVDGGEPL